MKPHKLFVMSLMVIMAALACSRLGIAGECQTYENPTSLKDASGKSISLQTFLDNYDVEKYLSGDQYKICFDKAKAVNKLKSGLVINGKAGKPLILDGLTIESSLSLLVTIAGQSVTFSNATLTGSGTLVEIANGATNISFQGVNNFTTTGTGPVIKIPANYGEFTLKDMTIAGVGLGPALEIPAGVHATIGPDVTIDNFAQGVFIKSGASAKITQDSIKVVSNLITDAFVFETPISDSMFSENLIGKHLSDTDTSYADKFVGQLTGKTADSCVGNVEAIYKAGENDVLPFNYLATCPLKWIENDEDKVTLKNKDNTTTELGANSCIFECKDINAAANYLVTFIYTDASGVTSDYLPSTPLVSDLAEVITVQSMPIYLPTSPQGGDGTTTIYTGDPAAFDPTADPKAAQTGGDTNNTTSNNNDGEQVNQGSGSGCGANISLSNTPDLFQISMSVFFAIGLPLILFVSVRRWNFFQKS